ncbi:sigma 54-interacting transcriptional regulator [Bacillus sp. REN10]|uniref:sigma-54 interaction domain-containing protein n=1 Tax=Bacillus sp. REN10 TaxID=2782541 RepID=UPI00193B9B0B|nr:sigma 54-interacting transcriptional regulator [Bacillus sp. REN10]
MEFSFKIEIHFGEENGGKVLIKVHNVLTDVLQSTLLRIYDELIITDSHGFIIKVFGKLLKLKGDTSDLAGMNLFEIGKTTFYDGTSLEELLNGDKRSIIQTTWNNERILITYYPEHKIEGKEYYTWGLKALSRSDNVLLENVIEDEIDFSRELPKDVSRLFIVKSQKMMDVLNTVEMAAKVSSSVLLLGESGVGKEVIARAIHDLGTRKNKPFIAVNCGAIPENLLESELFGYDEGAFSGAKKDGALGKFELANKGVLFLDEIGEMPLNLQVKLLRVLQEREVTRLGSSATVKLDIQIIAATNKDIKSLVKEGTFREDLYYRLNVIPITIPSLRERIEELPYLINFFLHKYNSMYDRTIHIDQDAIDLMSIYEWPGNIRQLENMIERMVVTSKEAIIDASAVQEFFPLEQEAVQSAPPIFTHLMPLQEAMDLVEEQLINMAMEKYKSIKLAAKVLDVSQPTMSRKYKKILAKLSEQNIVPSAKREILESQLNNRLRSVAIATAAIIQPEEVSELKKDPSFSNPIFQKLQSQLTMIRKQAGGIKWAFIFDMIEHKKFKTLAADKDFTMQPGQFYEGSPEFAKVAANAVKGRVEVTKIYKDIYGEWKTSLAPVIDDTGKVIALIGYDYSKEYIDSELGKMGKVLKINI